VADKDFHQHHARRASAVSVLARALGPEVEADLDTRTTATSDEMTIEVGLADPTLRLEMISQLIIDIDIPTGQHLYASGAPDAYTPLSIEVDGEGIRLGDPRWPTSIDLVMADLDLTVPAHVGHARVAIPITVTSGLVRLGHEITDSIDVSVTCRYQLCDDVACGLPQTVEVACGFPSSALSNLRAWADTPNGSRPSRPSKAGES
jgi:hypothetical protein